MKKLLCILAIAVAGTAVSCNKANNDNADPAETDFKKGGKILSPTDQQAKIENTATTALDQIDPDAFQPTMDLIRYFVENYTNDEVDMTEIEEVTDGISDDFVKTEENEWTESGNYYCYTFEKFVLDLSKFTGNFNANSSKWTYSPADKLTLTFKDQNGKDCLLEWKVSGNLGNYLLSSSYGEYSYYEPDLDGDGTPDYEKAFYREEYEDYVTIPEKINLTLKDDGSVLISASYELKTNVMDIDDYSQAQIDFNASFEFAGYKAEISRIYFKNGSAEVTTSLSSPSTIIVSESVKMNDIVFDENDDLGFSGGSVEAKLNLLGEVQAYVSIPDAYKFATMFNNGPEDDSDLDQFLEELNKTYSAEIHFDNTSAVQANLELRSVPEEDEDSGLTVRLVLVFEDGSSYAADEYFTEEMMDRIYDKLCDLVDELQKTFTID